jgi:hypothetical protein
MSKLGVHLKSYLKLRRGLGFKLHSVGLLLGNFVRFAETKRARFITTKLALQAAIANRTITSARKLSKVARKFSLTRRLLSLPMYRLNRASSGRHTRLSVFWEYANGRFATICFRFHYKSARKMRSTLSGKILAFNDLEPMAGIGHFFPRLHVKYAQFCR